MQMGPKQVEQIRGAYRRMADEARYHPAAPSDGWGNVTGVIDVEAQSGEYAGWWWAEEDSGSYRLGCPDHRDRSALIFIVEAARSLNGVNRELAADLLRMALADLQQRIGGEQ
jgi:hypothetical protein